MKFKQRLGFYLGGLSIGIVILIFIFKGKKTEFNYFTNSRVLNNINKKELVYSAYAIETIKNRPIDSVTIIDILKHGSVNLSKLDRDLDSCKIYVIEKDVTDKNISLTIENCNKVATILSITFD